MIISIPTSQPLHRWSKSGTLDDPNDFVTSNPSNLKSAGLFTDAGNSLLKSRLI